MKNIERPVFVTGLWTSAARRKFTRWDITQFEKSMAAIEGQNLIAFYDTIMARDFFRQMAFDHQIGLVAIPLSASELPANRYVDQFIKRLRAYEVTQVSGDWTPEPFEKAWVTYWKHYRNLGERGFRIWLSAQLSKVELTAKMAPEYSQLSNPNFAWVDLDFMSGMEVDAPLERLFETPPSDRLNHFRSEFTYMGRPLELGTHFLCAHYDVWQNTHKEYDNTIARLGHFPYVYDADVVMALTRVQIPQSFCLISPQSVTRENDEFIRRQA